MAKQKMLEDLFLDTLKDIYYAERQIVKALPKMAKAAESEELRTAFENHLQETHGQIERLQQAFFARVPDYPRGITVPAIVDVPSGTVVTITVPYRSRNDEGAAA